MGQQNLVITGADNKLRQEVLEFAGVERVMGVPPIRTATISIVVMTTIPIHLIVAGAGDFVLKHKALPSPTIMMVMGHHSMQQDDTVGKKEHCYRRYPFHYLTIKQYNIDYIPIVLILQIYK